MATELQPIGNEAFNKNNNVANGLSYNPPQGEEQSKGRVIKNLFIVCVAIFMYQNASLPCKELQSSINLTGGLGTATVSVQMACQFINNGFLATMFIRLMGLKYTICICLVTETLYFAVNMFPFWYTLIPAATMSGLFSMSLWPAKSSYITHVSHLYAAKVGANVDAVVNRFFGFFYMFYYFGYILGSVYSHYVLNTNTNITDISYCGADFCDYKAANSSSFLPPTQTTLYYLFGGFSVMVLAGAVLVLIFLDQIRVGPRLKIIEYLKLSMEIVQHFRYKNQILLSPVNFYRGLSSGFISADYTKAYVTCTWGVYYVGFVMMTFGACCGVASIVFGLLVKKIGRLPIFIVAAAAHVTVISILFTWKPNPDQSYMFFVVAGLWGVGHSCWESQIAALHGILFPNTKEQAFSCYVCIETLGGMIAFAVSSFLCIYAKLSMVAGFLAVSFVSFLCVEIPLMMGKNSAYKVT